ncbi:hypothetical protein GF351_06000 [Candidatus Woesearchaeota archaeon]|nr:hypothetical protein [Candidatus Woesearchaeota archaeon]
MAKNTMSDRIRKKLKKLFRKSKKSKRSNNIIIIGGGDTGLALANVLQKNNQIVIIEIDESVAEDIANRTSFLVINGDGIDSNVLKEAGIDKVDAFIATTGDVKTNLMGCLMAKNAKVKKIIAMVNSPKNESLFAHAEITKVISKIESSVTSAKKALYERSRENIIHLIGSDAQIIEFKVDKKSSFVGKKARLPKASIAAIIREEGSRAIIPTEKTKIHADDLLIVAAKSKHVPTLLEESKGE